MNAATVHQLMQRLLSAAILSAFLILASACGGETGFLVTVHVDPALEPGRDFDEIRLQIDPGNPAETTSKTLKIDSENPEPGPYVFLVLQGETRRYSANARLFVSLEGSFLEFGTLHETDWQFVQGELVEKSFHVSQEPR